MSGNITRRGAALLAAALALGTTSGIAQEPPPEERPAVAVQLEGGVHKRLEKVAKTLAKAGHAHGATETLEILAATGREEKPLALLRKTCDRYLHRADPSRAPVPAAAKELRRAIPAVLEALQAATGDQRTALAKIALRLDGSLAPAHAALGHAQVDGTWAPNDLAPVLERRRVIQAKMSEAARLPVEVEFGESSLPVLQKIYGKKGNMATALGHAVHSVEVAPKKLARILRQALRAVAFSSWLNGGELAVPVRQKPEAFVLFEENPKYWAAVEDSFAGGGLDKKRYDWIKSTGSEGYDDTRGYNVSTARSEADSAVWIVHYTFEDYCWTWHGGQKVQSTLVVGHLEWVCRAMLGSGLYPLTIAEWEETRSKSGTAGSEVETVEREEMLRLARAGLNGTRAYLKWAAAKGEDPAFSTAIFPQLGEVAGLKKTKATSVVEYLQEAGRFAELMKSTSGKDATQKTFEDALGMPLGEFEIAWKRWLFADRGVQGLLQRIEDAPVPETRKSVRDLLRELDLMRRDASPENQRDEILPLTLDADLTAGTRLHAVYLNRHREQLEAWPDAHEQYPDKEGFSARGCWSGLRSVIAPGSKDAKDAVDKWMATFYHRLPLLHPGLLRIGLAQEKDVVVLDCASLVRSPEFSTYAAWPPLGGTGLPTRWEPELPNPVPGEDQSKWGYPITLQIFHYVPEPNIQLRLLRAGKEVDCWYLTPSEPRNPRLAPAGAFCLIPKAPLESGVSYVVEVKGFEPFDGFEWAFSTGK